MSLTAIPNGNGAVRCDQCHAVLMPGTALYDWHGTNGCKLDPHDAEIAALRKRVEELEGALLVIRHCATELVICHRCRDAARRVLGKESK